MSDYLVCHGANLRSCSQCQRYWPSGQPIAAVFAMRAPITPAVQGVRCLDLRTAPKTAPSRGWAR